MATDQIYHWPPYCSYYGWHNGWKDWQVTGSPDFAGRVTVPSLTTGGTTGQICPWCSAAENGVSVFHTGPCPRIKAIEYYPDGTVKRVEFNE